MNITPLPPYNYSSYMSWWVVCVGRTRAVNEDCDGDRDDDDDDRDGYYTITTMVMTTLRYLSWWEVCRSYSCS